MSAATSHTPFFLLTPHLWALVCVHVCVWDGKWGWMSLNITRQKEDTISASIRLWVWVGKVIIVSSVRRDQMRQLISTFNQRNKYYTRGDFLETLKVHPKSLGISWRGWFQHLCFMRGKTCTLCLTKQLSSSQQPKDMGTVTISILQRKKNEHQRGCPHHTSIKWQSWDSNLPKPMFLPEKTLTGMKSLCTKIAEMLSFVSHHCKSSQ